MTRLPIPTPMPEGPLCEAHCQLWPCPRCERFEKRERIFMGVVMALTFHTVTLVGDCTLELIEPQSGVHYELRLFVRQDEVGGHKITWPSRIQWSARPGVPAKSSPGSTPLLTATPGATDSVTIARNGLGEYATAVSYDYRPGP
jgi:hypothetical protein